MPALAVLIAEGNDMIPAIVRSALLPVVRRLNELDHEIGQSDQVISALAKADETARRLMSVPGIGPITASVLATSIQDISVFSGPREFAAFLRTTDFLRHLSGSVFFSQHEAVTGLSLSR